MCNMAASHATRLGRRHVDRHGVDRDAAGRGEGGGDLRALGGVEVSDFALRSDGDHHSVLGWLAVIVAKQRVRGKSMPTSPKYEHTWRGEGGGWRCGTCADTSNESSAQSCESHQCHCQCSSTAVQYSTDKFSERNHQFVPLPFDVLTV